MYSKNTWYVARTTDEIAQKPLGRQICGEKWCFIAAWKAPWWLSRTFARIVANGFRWVMWKTAT